MVRDNPEVSFVLYVLKTCGKNDAVVIHAANNPIISKKSIIFLFFLMYSILTKSRFSNNLSIFFNEISQSPKKALFEMTNKLHKPTSRLLRASQ